MVCSRLAPALRLPLQQAAGTAAAAAAFSLQTDAYVPLITDAEGLPCNVAMKMNADSTRMKFGRIQNCATGVWVTASSPDTVIM